jgi:hypothetical protein
MQSRVKATAVAVVVALVSVGLFITIALLPRKKSAPAAPRTQNRTLSVVEEAARAQLSEDGDQDGLKDWEEALWNTARDNPDSDNDGTVDGEEVQAGRNPAVKGPHDTLKAEKTTPTTATTTETDTKTARFGRELFAEYMAKKQSGLPITESDTAAMLTPLIASYAGEAQLPKYSIADIKVGEDSKNELRRYGNELGAIDRQYGTRPNDKTKPSELEILARFAANPEGGSLDELAPVVAQSRTLVTAAAALEVPSSFVVAHVDFLNHLSGYADVLETVADFQRDPLASLVALQRFEALTRAIYADAQKVARRFKDEGVTFVENEDGYVFAVIASLPATLPQATP